MVTNRTWFTFPLSLSLSKLASYIFVFWDIFLLFSVKTLFVLLKLLMVVLNILSYFCCYCFFLKKKTKKNSKTYIYCCKVFSKYLQVIKYHQMRVYRALVITLVDKEKTTTTTKKLINSNQISLLHKYIYIWC